MEEVTVLGGGNLKQLFWKYRKKNVFQKKNVKMFRKFKNSKIKWFFLKFF